MSGNDNRTNSADLTRRSRFLAMSTPALGGVGLMHLLAGSGEADANRVATRPGADAPPSQSETCAADLLSRRGFAHGLVGTQTVA